MNHDAIHHEAEAMMEGGGHGHGKKLGAGTLAELQNVLMIANGFLTLTDEEFQHHLHHIQGVFNGVATYSELVKAVTEIAGGAIGISASYASVIAKLAGDSSLAAQAAGIARTAIMIGYAELKYAAHLYWEANLGLTTGFMRLAYETIQRNGDSIARSADALTKTQLLLQEEKDPEKLEALKKLEVNTARELGRSVDSFIDDAAPHGFEAGVAYYPGAYSILREAFAPVAKYKGAKTPEAASAAARFALEKITWSIANASEIVVMSARQKHLADVERDLAKKQEHGGEE